jgi:hypothetical protein
LHSLTVSSNLLCFSFLVSCFSFLVSCFLFLASCFLLLVSCFLVLVSRSLFLISHFSFLISHFSYLISHFISYLISHFISYLISHISYLMTCWHLTQDFDLWLYINYFGFALWNFAMLLLAVRVIVAIALFAIICAACVYTTIPESQQAARDKYQ